MHTFENNITYCKKNYHIVINFSIFCITSEAMNAKQKTKTNYGENIMSIFNKPVAEISPNNGDDKDWNVSTGMHQAVCAGACFKEGVEVTYEGKTKIQDQIQLYFAVQDGDEVKTILSRPYNFSFHKKATLAKDIATWGVTINTAADFIGAAASVVVAKKDGYTNINSILPAQGETEINMDEVFIPKFWLTDNNGNPTGFEIQMLEGVDERPLKED